MASAKLQTDVHASSQWAAADLLPRAFKEKEESSKSAAVAIAVAVLLVSAALRFLLLRLWRSGKARRLPPGSMGWPVVGETLESMRCQRRNRSWEFVQGRVAKYGEVFKTSLYGEAMIAFCSAAGNKHLFTNENKLLHVSWPPSIVAVLGKHSLTGLHGQPSKRIRQAIMTFLRPETLQSYLVKADAYVVRFIAEHWEGHEEVKVFPLMKRFTFALACELLMSRHDAEEQRRLQEPFATMLKGMLTLPIRLPGTRFAKSIAAANTLRAAFQPWIHEKRAQLAAGLVAEDGDLLACLLSFKDEEGGQLTDEEVKDNILLLLFAGHDTSTIVTTFVCKFLAENPSILDEVCEENMAIAAGKGPGEPLYWADLQRMKKSWRVVQETMRLQPPVQGTFRVVDKEFEYGGFRIPKSWKLYWSVNSTHRDPRYFKEPTKFDPSHFEGTGPPPYTFVPFGGGPRMCPGYDFARMEALLLLYHLSTRFRWSLIDPSEAVCVDPMPYPVNGLHIHLHPRVQP